ncbi:MAG: ABC transporter ATP-binding protein, partial [Flavisolibacter sp.]|nr:ABC transporter ATP-binding protein [Flavisolibacter sp.]
MASLLSIQNLSIDFVTEGQKTEAVKDISFTVNRGEIVALVGESGSGKSVTALSILQLLPTPPAVIRSGKILFQHNEEVIDILQLSQEKLRQIRGHHIAMIFQEPMTSLNPVLTCGYQVAEAIQQHKKTTKAAARQQTVEWFSKVKLPEPENFFERYPHQLSGGQKQRVMIAMAMCCQPSLLICDEPTTALDVTVQKTILELIKELQQEQNMGVIFITHDLGIVAEVANRTAIMYKGEVLEQNQTKAIFQTPQHPYTKALIACRPALHPKGEKLPVVSDFMQQENEDVDVKSAPAVTDTHHLHNDEPIVQVKNLTVQYPVKTNLFGKVLHYFTAVDNVSFVIYKGETLGLVGESGCGKTTLGRTLLHLVEPSSGNIFINENDLTAFSKNELKQFRKDVQLIFQDPFSSLNPRLTIGAAIAEPMYLFGLVKSQAEQKKKVAE